MQQQINMTVGITFVADASFSEEDLGVAMRDILLLGFENYSDKLVLAKPDHIEILQIDEEAQIYQNT